MQLPPSDDPVWVQFMHQGARTIERGWREHGLTLPPGVASVLGRVTWEYLRRRTPPLKDGEFFHYPASRLTTLVHQVESELPGGPDNPAFLNAFGERLREDLERYEGEEGDPSASA